MDNEPITTHTITAYKRGGRFIKKPVEVIPEGPPGPSANEPCAILFVVLLIVLSGLGLTVLANLNLDDRLKEAGIFIHSDGVLITKALGQIKEVLAQNEQLVDLHAKDTKRHLADLKVIDATTHERDRAMYGIDQLQCALQEKTSGHKELCSLEGGEP